MGLLMCRCRIVWIRVHRFRLLLALILSAAIAPIDQGYTQAYPARPITLVVPFAAGGSTDLLGRMIADGLRKALGQPVIVENKSGGPGASIGTGLVARAAPDGYTILLGSATTHAVGPNVYRLPYDTLSDFAPVALVARITQGLVVPKDLPVHSVAELIDYARRNPDKFTTASYGSGTLSHLQNVLFQTLSGTKLEITHYRGSGPAIVDLLGGTVQAMFDNISSSIEYHRSGQLRILAVTSGKRIDFLPDVPAIAETVPGFDSTSWFAVFAPAKTPQPILDTLSNAIIPALKEKADEIQTKFGLDVVAEPAHTLANVLRADFEKWRQLTRQANLRLD